MVHINVIINLCINLAKMTLIESPRFACVTIAQFWKPRRCNEHASSESEPMLFAFGWPKIFSSEKQRVGDSPIQNVVKLKFSPSGKYLAALTSSSLQFWSGGKVIHITVFGFNFIASNFIERL
jgi:hypothetical protein